MKAIDAALKVYGFKRVRSFHYGATGWKHVYRPNKTVSRQLDKMRIMGLTGLERALRGAAWRAMSSEAGSKSVAVVGSRLRAGRTKDGKKLFWQLMIRHNEYPGFQKPVSRLGPSLS
ncbi:MAG TPA: hypothetical protein VGQ00_02940 [Candidatus Norongarragalinales archaeon]|jgi:hypothetical protein|nr:hypothetical protein [Candidatus Norongarragalinales archaeon]